MARKVGSEVALNGPWSRALQPGLPDTVETIVAEGIACARAGACIVHVHAYDGGGLSAEQKSLRAYYSDLLALAQAPEIRGKRFWGLQYINSPGANPDANANLFSFARFATDNGSLILVVTNFGTGKSQSGPLRVPDDLSQAAGLPATVDLKVTLLLDGSGAKSDELAATTREALASAGLVVDVADQATNVYRVSP